MTTTSFPLSPTQSRRQAFLEAHRLAGGRADELAVAHDDAASDDGEPRQAPHALARERGPAAAADDPGIIDHPIGLTVDDREVGVVADDDAALANDAEDARRPGAGEVDESLQAQLSIG